MWRRGQWCELQVGAGAEPRLEARGGGDQEGQVRYYPGFLSNIHGGNFENIARPLFRALFDTLTGLHIDSP